MNFDFSGNRVFATWSNLPVLNSVLHWTYHQFNQTVDIAYLHGGVTTSNWVAWGLNVGGSGMRGTQCLGAFQNSSGSIHAYTSPSPPNPPVTAVLPQLTVSSGQNTSSAFPAVNNVFPATNNTTPAPLLPPLLKEIVEAVEQEG
nr:cytochrome B561 and DOMON domain-containing protein At5g47530-like [Ipomoea batatas]